MPGVRPAVFLDFDGTITTRDATDAILEAYADPGWLQIEEAWKAGRIGSRECLTAQMMLVKATAPELERLLDGIEIDPGFTALVERCSALSVAVHIVSDGFDYCIDRILRRPSLHLARYLTTIRIVSTHLRNEGTDWRVSFGPLDKGCVHGCATCKPAAMARLNMQGGAAIFVGDGLSDRYAAAAADLVFAKNQLAAYCDEEGILYTPFDDLATIAMHLEPLLREDATMTRAKI
jgi:2,3-diketo-5-methylthio-1-phosphopentane phosphatase